MVGSHDPPETDVPDIQPGLMLTHYRLVEKLGEGGMGVVWRAFDTRLNRHVALKLLRPELTSDPERQRRFMREARAAAAVSHPNIVTIYQVDELGGSSFLCMELIEGRTLRAAILDSRPLSLTEILRIVSQVAEGLARAHREGIVHRDLKPENVILGPDGNPKILDFGLAKLIESRHETLLYSQETRSADLTGTGMIVGTSAYMSPEQVRGDPVDARSDIFSFGVLLYEMVSKRRPFQGSSQVATLAAILHEPAAPVSRFNANVPSRLEEILNKCLDKDPRDRYQSSEDLAVDLRRLRKELESGPLTASENRQAAAPAHRRVGRRAWLGTAAVIVVLAAGVGLLKLRPGPELPAPAGITHARNEIAVLPFQNLSAEGPHAYFAGGLQDELLTQLAKVASLKVISRTSVMGYQGTTKSLKAIAGELGVGSMVEGSVQVVGERLRVNVQLIDAATDEHLWAERYDRTLDDAFAIQSEVAQQIVAAVGAALSSAEQERLTAAPTQNAEAYRLYLQGNEYLARPGFLQKDLKPAQQLLERALALDPNFVLAHATLSRVHGFLYWFGYDPSPARLARTREEAEVALRLAPDLPEAHGAMGWAHYCNRDHREAVAELAIAVKGLPNDAVLWRLMGVGQRRLGNWKEAVAAFEKAAQLNPRDADLFHVGLGHTFVNLRRYSDAVHAYERALSLAPDIKDPAISLGWTYVIWQGQLDTLRAVLDRLPRTSDIDLSGQPRALRIRAVHRADFFLYARNPDSLLQMPEMARPNLSVNERDFQSSDLFAAWAHRLRGDNAAAKVAFDSARVQVDSRLREFPEAWDLHFQRGMALAGLGRRNEALQEAHWLQQSVFYREDALDGPAIAEDRALILAQIGEAEAALDEIGRLLAGPTRVSVHTLRLDPRWDPIRDHPRFKELLVKYADAERSHG